MQNEVKVLTSIKTDAKIRNNSTVTKDTDKLAVAKPKNNDDSQSNSQKDFIVRKIKKKNENSKGPNSTVTGTGFGHK